MKTIYIDHSSVNTPEGELHLNNILYVPKAKKNLIFIHLLTSNNSAFIEFHPDFFLFRIKKPGSLFLRGATSSRPLPFSIYNKACLHHHHTIIGMVG
jgi:hypothetical protein